MILRTTIRTLLFSFLFGGLSLAAPRGIWITPEELSTLPTSGPSWDQLKAQADQSAGTPDLADQGSDNNVYVMAKALVYARTGIERYRQEVIDQCMRAIGTEEGGRTLALGRNLAAFVFSADLVGLPEAEDLRFRSWLRTLFTKNLDGRTLRSTHEDRPNNWGTMAGASRIAAALYLGDTAELEAAAQVFRGWLGDRSVYAGFKWGDLDWQADLDRPVGINPPGSRKEGHSIDGVLADDQRRGGGFTWPPPKENYVWEALQGALVQAVLLKRAGYDSFSWSDEAMLRAYRWLYDVIGYPPTGDDTWQAPLVDYYYGTHYWDGTPTHRGKISGWTCWSHSQRTSPPPPLSETQDPPDPPQLIAALEADLSDLQISSVSPGQGKPGTLVEISGQNLDKAIGVSFNGIPADYFAVTSSTSLEATVPAGVSDCAIVVKSAGAAAGGLSFSVTDEATREPLISSLTFQASADTRLSEEYASSNYGDSDFLRVRQKDGGRWVSIIQFDLTSLNGTPTEATLRLWVTDPSDQGGSVRLVENGWNELEVSWGTRPGAISDQLDTPGEAAADTWVEFDVSEEVTGKGIYTFLIEPESTNSVFYSTREGPRAPELLVVVEE